MLGRAPLGGDGIGHAGGQLCQTLLVAVQRIALLGGAQRPLLRVVGNALLQAFHQRQAAFGALGGIAQLPAITLQLGQQSDNGFGRVQAHAAAHAGFAAGVVGQYQCRTFLGRRLAAQSAPALG